MSSVNVTELRSRLPDYLKKVRAGEEISVTSRGKVIARLIPEHDESEAARGRLAAIRKTSFVGDVVSPVGDAWEADRDSP